MAQESKEYTYDFFIAYSEVSKSAAVELFDELKKNAVETFLDVKCLSPGDLWNEVIPAAQRSSEITLALISTDSTGTYYEEEEIAAAVELSRTEDHRIVPIYLDPTDGKRVLGPYGLHRVHSLYLAQEGSIPAIAKALLPLVSRMSSGPQSGNEVGVTPPVEAPRETGNPGDTSGLPDSEGSGAPTVLIVGSGFSGTVTAIRLIQLAEHPLKLVILHDRAADRYGGLAYGQGATSWDHVLNIQAGRLSIFREHPVDFLNWVNVEADKVSWPPRWSKCRFGESTPVPRRIYGQYLQSRFDQARAKASELVQVKELEGEVEDLVERARIATAKCNLSCKQGAKDQAAEIEADQVILATGHGQPIIPRFAKAVQHHPQFVASPYSPRLSVALQELGTNQDVLIIGSGLSAFDAVISLNASRYQGRIILCSRHGHIHATYPDDHKHDIIRLPRTGIDQEILSSKEMVEVVRREFQRGEEFLDQYHPTLAPTVRPERILKSLEPWIAKLVQQSDRQAVREFLFDLKSWLTTRRTSVVPEVGDTIRARVHGRNPQVEILPGSIVEMAHEGHKKISVSIETESGLRKEVVGAVISCVGLEADYTKIEDPLWRQLIGRHEAAVPHIKTGLGVEVGGSGELVRKDGSRSNTTLAVGPMRQGDEIERRGRVGAFTFSIGTIRNQALTAALTVLKRVESDVYAKLNNAERYAVERLVVDALRDPNLRRVYARLAEGMKDVLFVPSPPNFLTLKKNLVGLCRKILSEIDVPSSISPEAVKHILWHRARLKSSLELADISQIPTDYAKVRTYGETARSKFLHEQTLCKSFIRKAVGSLRAESGSLLIYASQLDELRPFAEHRRRDLFTPTKYGEAITGNLLRFYNERTPPEQIDNLSTCFEGDEIKGILIPDYNDLNDDLKKGSYRDSNHRRKYPSVLVALLTGGEGRPLGVLYLEAASARQFECEDLNQLLSDVREIMDIVEDASSTWDATIVDRIDGDFSNADLRGANFARVNLSNADFIGADLRGADLSAADLSGAKCIGANLRDAKLVNARLVNSNFRNADLSSADLRGASIVGTVLVEATLRSARIAGATMEDADFSKADLSNVSFFEMSVRGLEFSEAVFRGARLQSLSGVAKAKWKGADLEGASIEQKVLEDLPRFLREQYRESVKVFDLGRGYDL